MNPPNPNKANQYQLDPRQKLCWDFYVDPKSETFGNGTQSAIKAGYTEGYADAVLSADWFCVKLWELNSVFNSVKVFKEVFEASHIDPQTNKIDSGVLRIKADVAKFLASTKGKDEGYSNRTELTGKDGGAIKTESIPDDEFKSILASYGTKPREENTST